MLQSFVIMLREGIEAALVVAITLVVLKRSGRRDLERPVFWGVGLAVLASIGGAVGLQFLPLNEDAYEGALYWASALFVISMMAWMHRNARSRRTEIEHRIQRAADALPARSRREALALGGFAFLMVFREGVETVLFLSAVNLTTDALLSFIGSLLGLTLAVVFCVMFVRGSLKVNVRRFFSITEWVLGMFVAQLLVNGYHELAEAGVLPATQRSMALVGPIVRQNSLFVLAIISLPLILWLTRSTPRPVERTLSAAERRLVLAAARRDTWYRSGAIATTLLVVASLGVLYAREAMPKHVPSATPVAVEGGWVTLPLSELADGQLHRLGFASGNTVVRFLALKTADGKIHTALDACEICGAFGYVQEGKNLVCLNCAAEINPLTLGAGGGCNPIPLPSEITNQLLRVGTQELDKAAHLFPAANQTALTSVDPVCGMMVKLNEAAAFEIYRGRTYYFCSERCRGLFHRDPATRTPMK